eukprot:scaffold24499_cov109-Isochrysis_galbana.AAC.5
MADGNVVFELNTDGVSLYPPIEERADEVFEGDSESGRSVGRYIPSPPPASGQPAPTARNRQKSQLGRSSRFYWEDGNVCVAVGRRNPPRL